MHHVLTHFSYLIKWNFFESAYYQLIVLIHYTILHHVIDAQLFAQMGSLFSLIYLTRTIVEGGIEATITSHFHEIQSKIAVRSMLFEHVILPSLLLYPMGLCITGYIFYAVLQSVSFTVLCITALQVIIELCKRIVKLVLGLILKNKEVAIIEGISVSTYIIFFWILYARYSISLEICFGLYLCTTIITTIALAMRVWKWYAQLPEDNAIILTVWQTHRMYVYASQLMGMIFSGNFIVPLLASRCKTADAGLFYLAHTITYSINKVFRHTFGYSTQTMFVWLKDTLQETHSFIHSMSMRIYAAMSSLMVIGSIAYAIHLFGRTENWHTFSIIMLFFLLEISENLFLVFEQICITHDGGFYLFMVSIGTIIITGCVLWYAALYSTIILFLALLIIRCIKFGIIQWLMYKKEHQLLKMKQ